MSTRLDDMLALVSRVQEKRPRVRLMLRQDPDVDREVHVYLDDLVWLSQRLLLQPTRAPMAAGREQLLATLAGHSRRRRALRSRVRRLAAAASASLLIATALSSQAATHGLPQPVEQVLSGFFAAQASQANLAPAITAAREAHGAGPSDRPSIAESMLETASPVSP